MRHKLILNVCSQGHLQRIYELIYSHLNAVGCVVGGCCAIKREKNNVIALHILVVDCYSMRRTGLFGTSNDFSLNQYKYICMLNIIR